MGGCKTADACVPYGEECPFNCPLVPPTDCGEAMMNCGGPTDANGCMTADTCVPHGEVCPHYCSYFPPTDCGQGMMNCPGGVDSMGCQMGDTCVAYGDECPYNCPHVPFNDCASQGMQNCPGPMDPMEMNAPTTAPMFPSMTAHHRGCRTALDQWTRWDAKWRMIAFPLERSVPVTVPSFL